MLEDEVNKQTIWQHWLFEQFLLFQNNVPYTPASLMYTHTLETHSVLPEMHLEMPFLLTDISAQLNLNFCLLIATILCRLSAWGGTVFFKVGARKDNIFLDLFLRYYLDFLPFFFGVQFIHIKNKTVIFLATDLPWSKHGFFNFAFSSLYFGKYSTWRNFSWSLKINRG